MPHLYYRSDMFDYFLSCVFMISLNIKDLNHFAKVINPSTCLCLLLYITMLINQTLNRLKKVIFAKKRRKHLIPLIGFKLVEKDDNCLSYCKSLEEESKNSGIHSHHHMICIHAFFF